MPGRWSFPTRGAGRSGLVSLGQVCRLGLLQNKPQQGLLREQRFASLLGFLLRQHAVAIGVRPEEETTDQKVPGVGGLFLRNLVVIVGVGQFEHQLGRVLQVRDAVDRTGQGVLLVVGVARSRGQRRETQGNRSLNSHFRFA